MFLAPPCEAFKEGWLRHQKRNATLAAQTGWSFKVAQTLKNHPVRAFKGSVSFFLMRVHPSLNASQGGARNIALLLNFDGTHPLRTGFLPAEFAIPPR